MPEPTKPALCLVALLSCAALLGGCAEMPGAYDYVTEAGHAPIAPDASRGTVCFFRPETSLLGLPAPYYVQEDGRDIGMLDYGTWFVHRARPGMHLYTISTESTARTVIPAKAHEVRYVKCSSHIGVVVGRPNMEPSTPEEFKAASPELKRIRPATAKEKQAMEAKDRQS